VFDFQKKDLPDFDLRQVFFLRFNFIPPRSIRLFFGNYLGAFIAAFISRRFSQMYPQISQKRAKDQRKHLRNLRET
jgi:hypothetical protein